MADDLKPCPFCGAPAEQDYQEHYRRFDNGMLDHAASIYCTGCDARMTACRADHRDTDDEGRMGMLVLQWNRREEKANG